MTSDEAQCREIEQIKTRFELKGMTIGQHVLEAALIDPIDLFKEQIIVHRTEDVETSKSNDDMPDGEHNVKKRQKEHTIKRSKSKNVF
jgi:hypothetical protein